MRANNLHPGLCEGASNSRSIFTACFVFMVHACRVSARRACVYDEEAEPGARKNPASRCEARGQPRVKLLPLKEGGRICKHMGFCSQR